MAELVLASASARRRAFLEELGVRFEMIPADVPERPAAGESPEAFAGRVARDKVRAVAALVPGRWVLGADTVVVIDGNILGKPRDRADARRMLRALSGRAHRVCTAVVLQSPLGDRPLDELAATTVEFRQLEAAEIEAYLDSGEPLDKAGAYAIQGGAAAFVLRVDGSYTNVVGLPMEMVAPALRRAGLLGGDPAKASL